MKDNLMFGSMGKGQDTQKYNNLCFWYFFAKYKRLSLFKDLKNHHSVSFMAIWDNYRNGRKAVIL